jgi:cytochrome c oxidase subunit 3
MSISLVFMFIMMAVVVWWLFQQVFAKPWAKEGAIDDQHAGSTASMPAGKVGLWVFLAVITSMFSLFASAYVMRMAVADWAPLPEPNILWFNTGLLILSSVAMQWTHHLAQQGSAGKIKTGLILSGISCFAFLAGQLLAWQQLNASGYFLTANPANAFFYLLTALHGIHLAGGLWVWARTAMKLFSGVEIAKIRLSIELCTVYWHYLLLVWLALFALMLST